jgi:hypothetical protein
MQRSDRARRREWRLRSGLRAWHNERITRMSFRHPFFVGGLEAEQPSGTYEGELVEELLGLSFPVASSLPR